jgi:phenylacetate-CoA ligase
LDLPDEETFVPDLSVEALRALQLSRLQATLERVYAHSKHYRAAFNTAGVTQADLVSLDDLVRFPFTTKQDLRRNYPFDFFCAPMESVARVHASSGTTGQPTVVGYSHNDLRIWGALVARSLRAAGVRPGMRVHIAYGYGLFTGGLGAHYGAEALGCTVIPASGGQTERQVMLICDFKPDVIMVTPSYMLAILDEFRRQGRDPRGTGLKIGVFGAEPWTEAMRQEIEQAFGIEAIDIYGLSEVLGPGVACETQEGKRGPTIWEDHFFPEVIDPRSGAPVADGELGELVFTSLTKEAMPVVRYRTRDLTRLLPGVGNAMRRMDRIAGRSDDMLIVRGVNLFPTQVEELVLGCEELSPHFEMVLSRTGRLDELLVRVEGRQGADATTAAIRLKAQIKDRIGLSAQIETLRPKTLDRSEGKARRVRDLRP